MVLNALDVSASPLNAANPDILQALTKLNVNLAYHETLLAQQGIWVDNKLANTSELNSEIPLSTTRSKKETIFSVVEGAIPNGPDGSGRYLVLGNKPFKDIVGEAAKNANAILAVGACACWGGITSAKSAVVQETDHTGAALLKTDASKGILSELNIDKPVINIAGCPPHPDRILSTLGAVILGKIEGS